MSKLAAVLARLDEIKARAEKATVGPWKTWAMDVRADPRGTSDLEDSLMVAETSDEERGLRTFNATFIAAARTDVPDMVAALHEAVELLRDAHGIMWMAREYAEAGGTRGPEMREYQPVEDALREALGPASTPKP